MKHFSIFWVVLFLLFTVSAPLAFAKKGVGHSHGEKKGWGDKDTPPGWEHGKKKGWDGEKTPPGFKKKD